MAEWLVWTTGCRRRSLCAVGEGGCVNRRTGSRLVDLENPPLQQTHTHTHTRCAPCRALMADYVNEEDQPEDQTSFNPETELNNTDATCAFKCLFEGLIVLSRGFFFPSFFPSFSLLSSSSTSQSSRCVQQAGQRGTPLVCNACVNVPLGFVKVREGNDDVARGGRLMHIFN